MHYNPIDYELRVEATDPLPLPNQCPCGSERIETVCQFGDWFTTCTDCWGESLQGRGSSERASILDWNEQVPE